MLLFGAGAVALAIDDVVAASALLLISLWRHAVQLADLADVITFDVPSVEVVIDDVSILVPVRALFLQGVEEMEHVGVVGLVGDDAVSGGLAALVGGRNLGVPAHHDLHLPGVVDALQPLLSVGVDELPHEWIVSIPRHVLVCSLKQIDVLLLPELIRMIVQVAVVDDVEVLAKKCRHLPHPWGLLLQPRPLLVLGPVVLLKGHVGEDVVVHGGLREVTPAVLRALLGAYRAVATKPRWVFAWSQLF
mmetsp:Transcript_142978/g.202212  ORF Transcript_142978/g.202212 Transcript_142978/m.202212 type:complete len:247 (-) Transcript_142978:374-1114(-)